MTPCCDITISDGASSLKLGPFGNEGHFTFTCKNVLGRSFPGITEVVRVQEAGASEPVPAWISVAPKHEFERDAAVVVVVTAKLPPGTAAGKLQFKLRVSNELVPNDEYAESRPVALQIEKAEPDPLPKWLIPALAAGVALIALVGGIAWWATRAPAVLAKDAACGKAVEAQCGPTLICTPTDQGKCLSTDGQTCKQEADCASGRCSAKELCMAAPGQACNPSTPCPDPHQTCSVNALGSACTLAVKERCLADTDCSSGGCGQNSLCVAADGSCDAADACVKGLNCVKSRCLIPVGGKCRRDHPEECETASCGPSQTCEDKNCGNYCAQGTACVDGQCRTVAASPPSGGLRFNEKVRLTPNMVKLLTGVEPEQ